MPGNEKEVIEFIVNNRSQLNLPIIGAINKIEIPRGNRLEEITNIKQLYNFYSDDAHKKADVFINDKGISIKQKGGNVAYNKIQRKTLINFFNNFFQNKKSLDILHKLDKKIIDCHKGRILRDVDSIDIMNENEFKKILEFLMLKGSTTMTSSFPAELILIANTIPKSEEDIEISNFNKYYNSHKHNLVFALRRCWYGQISSEHVRANSIMSVKQNKPWCFDTVSGQPRMNDDGNQWRKDIVPQDRKTVFYINIIQK